MKILFVEPTFDEIHCDDIIFPFGYAALGAVLKANGHEVEYLLPAAMGLSTPKVLDMVCNTDADLIGIGGLVPYLGSIASFIKQMKQIRPDIPIVAGGAMVTYMPELALEVTGADFCIAGEGEVALLRFVTALETNGNYRDIPGLVFLEDGVVVNNGLGEVMPLEDVPLPDWDSFPMDYYLSSGWFLPQWSRTVKPRVFAWMLSRGCPSRCNFCVSGCTPRYKSIEAGVKELSDIVERFNPDYIMFVDNFLMRNEKFIEEFCRALIANDFTFKFSVTCKVNVVNSSLLRLMKKAGCEVIFYGLECANDEILRFMKKGITVDQAVHAITLTKEAGIYPMVSIMFGQPGETIDDFIASLKIGTSTTIEIDPVPNIASVMQLLTFPGTGIYSHAKKEGKFVDEREYWNKYGHDFIIRYNIYDQALISKLIEKANIVYRWKYHQAMADNCIYKLKEGIRLSDKIKRRIKLFLRRHETITKLLTPVLGENRIKMIKHETNQENLLQEFVDKCLTDIINK